MALEINNKRPRETGERETDQYGVTYTSVICNSKQRQNHWRRLDGEQGYGKKGGMTANHYYTIDFIKNLYTKTWNTTDIELEYNHPSGRRPDIYVPSVGLCLEVQHSPISKDSFIERTKDLGEKNTVWVLDADTFLKGRERVGNSKEQVLHNIITGDLPALECFNHEYKYKTWRVETLNPIFETFSGKIAGMLVYTFDEEKENILDVSKIVDIMYESGSYFIRLHTIYTLSKDKYEYQYPDHFKDLSPKIGKFFDVFYHLGACTISLAKPSTGIQAWVYAAVYDNIDLVDAFKNGYLDSIRMEYQDKELVEWRKRQAEETELKIKTLYGIIFNNRHGSCWNLCKNLIEENPTILKELNIQL